MCVSEQTDDARGHFTSKPKYIYILDLERQSADDDARDFAFSV